MKTVVVFRTGALGTWREKCSGMAACARASGWRLQCIDARRGKLDFAGIMDFWRPDGVIIDASGAPRIFDHVDFGAVPVVVMNPGAPIPGRPRPSVSSDSEQIAKLAAEELLALSPASLAFIEWHVPSIRWSAAKRRMIEKVAKMHAIPLTVVTPGRREAANPVLLERLLANRLAHLPRPCGVFAVTDTLGAVAVSAAVRIKAQIPDDIAIVSVDDDPEICENCSPTLSSVRPDFHRLGFTAVQLLDETARAAEGAARPGAATVLIPPLRVVQRSSTRPVRTCDMKVLMALETIRLKACEGIEPAAVAAAMGTSRRMAEIRFKAATGRSIGAEILERRLARACDYLKSGKTSVAAIADFCGWHSDLSFRKAFKSRFGLAPLQWRSRQAAEQGEVR